MPPVSPAPPLARDPWGWASALAALPLLLFSRGAPLGEPVADDYDYLRHMMFTHAPSWLDGGGSPIYPSKLPLRDFHRLSVEGVGGTLKITVHLLDGTSFPLEDLDRVARERTPYRPENRPGFFSFRRS